MADSEHPDDPPPRPLTAILWMVVTGLAFIAVNALVKYLGGRIPAIQSGFLRFALGLLFILPMIGAMRVTDLTRRDVGFFAARGVVHSLGVSLWFYAMTQIPIVEVTAMNYLVPVYVILGGVLFFGESFAPRRVFALGIALIGALVILRPGMREISTGHLAMLGMGLAMAGSSLIAKRMAGRFSPAVVVGWLSVAVTIGLFPGAMLVWVWPTMTEMLLLLGVAGCATFAHYTMVLAFRAAPLGVSQPVIFLQLVWASLLGVLVFGEALDIWVIIGGLCIITAISFVAWREMISTKVRRGPPLNTPRI